MRGASCSQLSAPCWVPGVRSLQILCEKGHTYLQPYLLGDHVPSLTDDSIRAAVTPAVGGL